MRIKEFISENMWNMLKGCIGLKSYYNNIIGYDVMLF